VDVDRALAKHHSRREVTVKNRFDFAKVYYWQIEFVEPQNPDDDRYVLLHGDEGEIVGPMTMALAEAWIRHFSMLRETELPRASNSDARAERNG
jgi:hypothetical protein